MDGLTNTAGQALVYHEDCQTNDKNLADTQKALEAGGSDQQDLMDNEQLNEALESYAETHNLTTQKVKNIIYHIVKNPQTFATLVRKDPDAMTGLRMTRYRLRQLERIARRSIPPVELRPISVPKTFLDVNYGEGEEEDTEDADYNPGEDSKKFEAFDKKGHESTSASSSSDNEDDLFNAAGNISLERVMRKPTYGQINVTIAEKSDDPPTSEFLTEVDNPIYPMFVKSVIGNDSEMDPITTEQLYNEENDTEYVFQEFDDLCAEDDDYYDEFRKDRATEIPRWELKALERDFMDAEGPTALDVPMARQEADEPSSKPSQETRWEPEYSQHTNECQQTVEIPRESTLMMKSCSLLLTSDQLSFTGTELLALKVQMEKHVQLLCQCIVGTSQYPELINPRNQAIKMLRDLDATSEQLVEQPHSLFHISNLQAALFSAHDIQACQEVDLPLRGHNENQPSKETMWVLARSEACRYPELFPPYQFSVHTQGHAPFLPSEQLLLAMAIYQLRHVPPRTFTSKINQGVLPKKGRYSLIAEHFVATKTLEQIRNHLKNVRSCPSPTLIQKIVCQAERGVFDVKYRPDLGETARTDIPLKWPSELQPFWLKWITDVFRKGEVEVMAVSFPVPAKQDQPIFKRHLASQMLNEQNKRQKLAQNELDEIIILDEEQRGEDHEMDTFPEEMEIEAHQPYYIATTTSNGCTEVSANGSTPTSGQEEIINEQSPPSTVVEHLNTGLTTMVDNDGTQLHVDGQQQLTENSAEAPSHSQPPRLQKKSRRKLRVERGLAALSNPEASESTMRALVEAVCADFKQRMFMHQDKFRAIQSVLHRTNLPISDRFALLWNQLGQSHPQLFFLFAAISPDYELPHSLRVNPDRLACKIALKMLHTIQTYMSGSRSVAHIKNTFKFLKEARETLNSEDVLFGKLQRHFGIRDEPLWKLLRRQWMGSRCAERVEEWQFESVDLDLNRLVAEEKAMEETCQYETVKLPYRHDPTERCRLRVRHGRVTVELNGRLRSVNIEYPQKIVAEEAAPASSTQIDQERPAKTINLCAFKCQKAIGKWTRDQDAMLLSEAGRDRQKCVDNFLASSCDLYFSRDEVENRLQSLVDVAKQLQKGNT